MSGSALSLYTPQEEVALAEDVWKLANRLAETEFVPKQLRGRPEAVMATMVKGAELGIPLMSSLAQIHVIDGRPTMSAELMRAVVQSKGHDIEITESNSTRCIVVGRRAGKDRDQTFTWTIDDAKNAGLLSKEVWRKYPAAMLLARATGVLCRAVFADCLAGISYTREELEDGEDTVGVFDAGSSEVVVPVAKGRTAKARQNATRSSTAPAEVPDVSAPETPRGAIPPLPGEEDIVDAEVVEEKDPTAAEGVVRPSVDEGSDDFLPPFEEPDPPVPDTGPRMSGPATIGMLMNDHGVKDRAGKQRAVAQLVGRQIESTKELTADETGMIIQFLGALGEGAPFPFQDDPPPEPAQSPAGPPPVRDAGPSPEDWTGPQWREFLNRQKMKLTAFMPTAKEMSLAAGANVSLLDEIAGVGIADDLVGWVLEQTGSGS